MKNKIIVVILCGLLLTGCAEVIKPEHASFNCSQCLTDFDCETFCNK